MGTKWLLLKKYSVRIQSLLPLPAPPGPGRVWCWSSVERDEPPFLDPHQQVNDDYGDLITYVYGLKILSCFIFKSQLITNHPYSFSLPCSLFYWDKNRGNRSGRRSLGHSLPWACSVLPLPTVSIVVRIVLDTVDPGLGREQNHQFRRVLPWCDMKE